ncbi:unnamed protein product [Camellia sinensis]
MVSAKQIFLSHLPDYFKEYMFKELNSLRSKYLDGVVFWSREDDEPQRVFWSREDDEPQRLSSTLPDGGEYFQLKQDHQRFALQNYKRLGSFSVASSILGTHNNKRGPVFPYNSKPTFLSNIILV